MHIMSFQVATAGNVESAHLVRAHAGGVKLKRITSEINMNITVDIEIDSPKSKVWTAITDTDNWMNMVSGIIDLKILHRPEEGLIGLKWSETRKVFGKESSETMWITDCIPREYYCTRAENGGVL